MPAKGPESETAFVRAMRNEGQKFIPVSRPRINGRSANDDHFPALQHLSF
jgi:hypothetical protein